MENKIDALRKFFKISVAAFDMYHTVRTALGSNVGKTYMHELHLQAKKEIEKAEPDLSKIGDLLAIMERWTEENEEQPKPDSCDIGGIVHESGSEIIIDKESTVMNHKVPCCGNCHLPLDNIEYIKRVQIADAKYNEVAICDHRRENYKDCSHWQKQDQGCDGCIKAYSQIEC